MEKEETTPVPPPLLLLFLLCLFHSKRLCDEMVSVAKDIDCELFEGIYGWTQGPGYETRAEVLSAARLGEQEQWQSFQPNPRSQSTLTD